MTAIPKVARFNFINVLILIIIRVNINYNLNSMITIEGIKIDSSIEALSHKEGEEQGFLVRVNTSWRVNKDKSNQEAITDANSQGLLGLIHNGHEATYADAQAAKQATVNQFVNDITTLIDNYNNPST